MQFFRNINTKSDRINVLKCVLMLDRMVNSADLCLLIHSLVACDSALCTYSAYTLLPQVVPDGTSGSQTGIKFADLRLSPGRTVLDYWLVLGSRC